MEPIAFSTVFDAVVAAVGDREFLVSSASRRTYGEVHARTTRFARFLTAQGLGCHRERSDLRPHESGQDHVGICVGNRPEYVEVLFGSMRARCAPANVNYRYVAEELAYLIEHCGINVLVYEAESAHTIQDLLEREKLDLLVEVGGTGQPAVPGAVAYDDIVDDSTYDAVALPQPHPDDVCVVCTGGTTGMPKAVLWHQGELLRGVMGRNHTVTGAPIGSLDDLVDGARLAELIGLCASPLMHFAGTGMSMLFASVGARMVIADPPRGFDPADVLRLVEQERISYVSIVGDAFGGPLATEMEAGNHDTSSLAMISSGGAALSSSVKARLVAAADGNLMVKEGLGSSESGLQARNNWTGRDEPGVFEPGDATCILDETRQRILDPTDDSVGWLATAGLVPLGYMGDPDKTRATFPTIDNVRYSVPGDYARWRSDGRIQLLGREATTINTGGEKVFAPEVEDALLQDEGVAEAVVLGRSSLRWGQEVVAIVVPYDTACFDRDQALATAARFVARYKLPKAILITDSVQRTATGKVDYRWARDIVAASKPESSERSQ